MPPLNLERRRFELAIIAALALLGFTVVWWLSERTGADALKAAIALGGAALTAALLPRYPAASIGVVFFLASLSIIDIDLSVGRMRLEQPAIAALLLGAWWHRAELSLASLREIKWPLVALAVYLGASAISSAFIAPDPGISVRLVLWTGLSMLGGLGAYLLTSSLRAQPIGWFAASGVFMSIVGLALAVAFYLTGPGIPLIYGPLSSNPKIEAFAFEANLYASLLSATAFFAIERWRALRTWAWAAATVIALGGIGVGITRGAYIGLAVGAVFYLLIAGRRLGFHRWLGVVMAVAIAATAVGMVAGAVLMDASVRDQRLIVRGDDVPLHGPRDDLATLDYRLERVAPSLEDIATNPIFGSGLASLDQIHPLPNDELNYINIMALATVHDSGIVGAVGLGAFFLILFVRLWRSSVDPRRAGIAAAYVAAVLTLLVSYQATSAIHFALNWLICGAALGLTVRTLDAGQADPLPAEE